MAISKLCINSHGSPLVNKNWEFFLNGEEISRFLSNIEISIECGGIAKVKLTLAVATIDIPEDLAALVVVEKGGSDKLEADEARAEVKLATPRPKSPKPQENDRGLP